MASQARRHNPAGSLLGDVVQLALLAAVGYVGWRVVQSYQAGQPVSTPAQLAQALFPSAPASPASSSVTSPFSGPQQSYTVGGTTTTSF